MEHASSATGNRTSLYVTAATAVAFLVATVVFATQTTWYFVFKMLHVGAAVVWVGGGLLIFILATLAELADDEDRLLEVGRIADTVASRLFPVMSLVVLVFGVAMTKNGDLPYDQFWLIFGLVAWGVSAATGILFLTPQAKRLTKGMAERGAHDPEVQARLRRIMLVGRLDMALLFLIVFDMTAKPFS